MFSNLLRYKRFCSLCNSDNGDDYHYILICQASNGSRKLCAILINWYHMKFVKKKIKCILLRLNNTCKISNVEDVKLAFRQNGKTVSMWGLRTFGTFSASSIKHLSRLLSSCALRLTFINCKNQILIIKTRPNNFETRKFSKNWIMA